ncbi:MAG: aspartate 1-decarboxylase [Phycisphaerae bacterium]|nr:aspartate 1-decarboxylase [Phycisphaerae bacterium]
MFCKVLRAKIHNATITQTLPQYVGSVTVDEDLLRATGIRPNEVVLIADADNGQRFETYVIAGEPGSGIIAINGAAAQLVSQGDRIIIFAHFYLPPEELDDHEARVVLVDEANRITKRLRYPSSIPERTPA